MRITWTKKKKALAVAIFLLPKLALAAFLYWSIAPVATDAKPVSSTKVTARDGAPLYEVALPAEGLRTAVSLDRMPQAIKTAIVATEDKRFFSHSGIDRLALIRAAYSSITNGRVVSGGSTIEMQLMKNLYFENEPRSILEKAREMVASEFWAITHTKSETLERYLNTIPLGNGTNGVAAAAQRYFRKDISDLTLGESALLAGMVNAPSRYDPYTHRSASLARRHVVLTRMSATGKLAADQVETIANDVPVFFAPRHEIKAPHFVNRVLDELESRFPDIRTGGYIITTTLDTDKQSTVENTITHRLSMISAKNANDAAAIMIDPATGDILAYAGSADYWDAENGGQIDMVKSIRQPGSALKPFLVFDALRNGKTPATVIADLPTRFEADGESYYPKNFTSRSYGPVTLRDALGSSLNVPMVKLLDEQGLHPFFATLAKFGIRFPNPPEFYGDGVILGGGEVSLHDVAQGYARLAAYGRNVKTRDVLEIRTAEGKIVWSAPEPQHPSLYEDAAQAAKSAALVADILSDNTARSLAFGEANLMQIVKGVAVKSGTTRDFRDNLAFGFTPDLVLGVWVGNANDEPMQGVTGVTGAVPILHDVLLSQLARKPVIAWPDPGGLVTKEICLPSGQLVSAECQKKRLEKFIAGTEPTETDTWWKRIGTKVTLSLPPEYAEWARRAKYAETSSDPIILSPLDGDAYVIDQKLPLELQSIPLTSSTLGGTWTLNGEKLKSPGSTYLWKPLQGQYELSFTGSDQVIHFSVR
jgi:penicillin-binding protein 1C